jgi:hypothetical protein
MSKRDEYNHSKMVEMENIKLEKEHVKKLK